MCLTVCLLLEPFASRFIELMASKAAKHMVQTQVESFFYLQMFFKNCDHILFLFIHSLIKFKFQQTPI